MADNGYARYSGFGSGGGGGGGVTSLNTLTGALTLAAGSGITITPSGGNTLTIAATNSGAGTVTSFSFVNSNGFSGSVANPTTTPALTLSTSFTGIAYSNGTGLAAAVAGNFPTLNQNTTGTASNITATSNSTLTTLSALSLPGSQVTGNISGNAGNITATSNSTLTTLSNLSLPYSQVTGTPTPLTFSDSLVQSGSTVTLVNDSASPGDSFFYGTNSSGTKGFYGIPTSMGGSAFYDASSQVTTIDSGNSTGTFTTTSNSPALTFTPTVSGAYKIYASMPLEVGTNVAAACRIFNTSGSATLLQESRGQGGASTVTGFDSAYCQTVYTLTAGTSYQFDIQTAILTETGSGTAYVRGDLTPFYMFAEQVATGTAANLVVGTIDGNGASANGLSILASTLYAQSASSSNPGMVNTASQTFAGSKNFTSPIGYNNTTPASNTAIDIINTTGATQRIVQTGYGGATGTRGRYANGTLGSPSAATSGNTLNFLSGLGYGTSQFAAASTGAINIVAGETFTNASNATYLQFNVTPTGSVTTAEQMRLNSTGNLLIGTTTDSGTQKLQVNGNSNVGTVTAGVWNGTVTAGQSVLTTGSTYTTPAGITTATRFKFTLVGGGGGGGGINTASAKGSGGGGGATVVVYAVGLSPSTGYTIAVGSGGAGGASTTTPAQAGGVTTISLDSVTYTAGGGGAGADTIDTAGGAGGAATNTFASGFAVAGLNIPGQQGFASGAATADAPWSTGGGSGMFMGAGGAALFGNTAGATGNPGTGYGGGGSGGNGLASTGGAGSGGVIIVEWNN